MLGIVKTALEAGGIRLEFVSPEEFVESDMMMKKTLVYGRL